MISYTLLTLLIIVLLLIIFFTGIELAFITSNRLNIELQKKQKKTTGIQLSRYLENPSDFLTVTLLYSSLCLVVYGLLFSDFMLGSFIHSSNEYLNLIVNIIIASLMIVFCSHFLARIIFNRSNSLFLGLGIYNFFYTIIHPLATWMVSFSISVLKYMFNVRIKENNFLSANVKSYIQQIKDLDDETLNMNVKLFEKALLLPNIKIKQCFVPRTEIIGINSNSSVKDVLQKFIETKLSKLIVYDRNIENIVGYVHQLDLFKKPATIKEILTPIFAVPSSMSVLDLLIKFSKEKASIAWVVDEFGGTAGIVSVEDLLEELFGSIEDEYDVAESDLTEQKISDKEYLFSGRLKLEYLNEKYRFEFPMEEAETLSGYIIHKHDSIPRENDHIIIGHYEFDILSVTHTRIKTIKMKILL
jgi:CBS domain containing-hemolysin-like protein